MKKFIALIIAASAIFALTACGHRHTIDDWRVDYYKHWHVCTECGEKTDVSAHDFGKDEICLVCGAKVDIADNGNIVVIVHDTDGRVKYTLVFDSEGNLINPE